MQMGWILESTIHLMLWTHFKTLSEWFPAAGGGHTSCGLSFSSLKHLSARCQNIWMKMKHPICLLCISRTLHIFSSTPYFVSCQSAWHFGNADLCSWMIFHWRNLNARHGAHARNPGTQEAETGELVQVLGQVTQWVQNLPKLQGKILKKMKK